MKESYLKRHVNKHVSSYDRLLWTRIIDPPYLHMIPIVPGALASADGIRKHEWRKKEGLKEACRARREALRVGGWHTRWCSRRMKGTLFSRLALKPFRVAGTEESLGENATAFDAAPGGFKEWKSSRTFAYRHLIEHERDELRRIESPRDGSSCE